MGVTDRDIAKAGIGGAGRNGRKAMDFYPTPVEVTHALLDYLLEESLISEGSTVWEPACGEGAMSEVIAANGMKVISTDIRMTGYGWGGVDFLKTRDAANVDWIITNPPFNVSEAFIDKCLRLDIPFALLLKSQYWHSGKRRGLFFKRQPFAVLPLTWRPRFTGNANLMDFLWTVWLPCSARTEYYPLAKPNI